jgi:hypothetical protein
LTDAPTASYRKVSDFTDEGLAFIIHDDIKYRMGRDSGGGDEE